MTYTIRNLSVEHDLDAAVEIFTASKKVMRTRRTRSREAIIEHMNRENTTYVGAFNNNELVAYLQYTNWGVLPVYQVGNMNIKSGVLQRYEFSNAEHPIIPIMDHVLSTMESQGRYTWYYNRSLANSYHKLQLEKKDLLTNCMFGFDKDKNQYRYDRYIEEVVEAGQVAKYKTHHAVLGDAVFDYGYMVVKCCLKPEYRTYPNYFDEETIKECMKTTPKIKSM